MELKGHVLVLLVFVLAGSIVGAVVPTLTLAVGAGYGFIAWAIVVVGICLCHVFD